MKIALGTVQFGLNYGIANVGRQVSPDQAARILHEARQAGIDTLDTAIAYGNSEQRLGELGVQDWKVISKIPALPESVAHVGDWVMQQVRGSLQRIGVKQLDGLLMHRPSDILGPKGSEYVRSLRLLRDEGLAKSIGYSIYSPDELHALLPVFVPEIVQAPYNIIDRRLVTTGWMERLADNGIRIHTRSTFLQGLLLIPDELRPPWFNRWKNLFNEFNAMCSQLKITPLQLSLRFVLANPYIERLLVGVDSASQLIEIINASATHQIINFPKIESRDLELIEPSRWRIQ
jgi:aryl-alcohol dehydrogenase-like predicted oxidoreductase